MQVVYKVKQIGLCILLQPYLAQNISTYRSICEVLIISKYDCIPLGGTSVFS